MSTSPLDLDPFALGSWIVVPRELRLDHPDRPEPVRLQQKEMHLLVVLAAQDGKPLDSESIRRHVWGDQAITDGVAKNLVWQLRRSLGESADDQELLETIPGAGYRLKTSPRPLDAERRGDPVDSVDPADSDDDVDEDERGAIWNRRLRVALLLAATALAGWLASKWLAPGDGRSARSAPRAAEPALSPVRPLAGLPGREADIALAPDGASIVFSWSDGGELPTDLYSLDLGDQAARPIRLTRTDDHSENGAAWSADGRRLAFVRGRRGVGEHEILVMSPTGGEARPVATLRSELPPHLAWCADGACLYVSHADPQRVVAGVVGLHRLELDTGTLTPVGAPGPGQGQNQALDRTPAVDPSGTRLAFARWLAPQTTVLVVRDLISGIEQTLTDESLDSIGSIAWHQSGDLILFTTPRDGIWSLRQIPADGSAAPEPVPALAGALDLGEVTASPGGMIAVEQSLFDIDLLRFDLPRLLDGPADHEPDRLVHSDRVEFAPASSPDGRRIAFLSDRTARVGLWIADLEPSGADRVPEPQQLQLDGLTARSHPVWSPDGSVLALSVVRGGQEDLVIVRPDDGLVEQVTDTPEREMVPSWRPDGLALRFTTAVDGRWELWEHELWNGARRKILDDAQRVVEVGGLLLASRPEGGLLLVEQGRPPRTLDLPLASDDWSNWAATEQGIVWVRIGETVVHHFDFATESIREILELEHPASRRALDVSADGRTLFVAVVVRDQSRILLVEPHADGD